jgi:ribosomal protein S18 acetylase RimI-like enzyme
MTENVLISDYCPDDFDGLMNLWQLTNLGKPSRGDDQQVIQKTLELGGRLLIMKSIPIGKIIGSSWMTTDGRRLFLHHFGILPEYQGRGLANLLMAKSMEFAKALGQQFKLEVHEKNGKAIKLYKKFGFDYLGDYHVYIIRDIGKV